jgi:uncharacterized protein (DUF4415 family)
MKEKRTTQPSPATASSNQTDWSRFDAMTDAEIEAAIRRDPDAAPPLSSAWLAKAKLVRPPEKEMISIRLDKDVLEHFRSQERWQTRINALLRMVFEHEKVDAAGSPRAEPPRARSAVRSIDNEGFLSPHIANWIQKHRTDNANWFSIAEGLNRTGQRLMPGATVTTEQGDGNRRLLAMLLFTRALSNFQGTILMAERGMVVEARTLARTCLESTFCLAAIVKGDSDFTEKMLRDEFANRKKKANWLLSVPERLQHCKPDAMQRLREYVENLNDTWDSLSALGIEEMARTAGLHDLYIFYRELSGDAAHPTITALNRYIVNDEGHEVREIRWGPKCNPSEIADTLNIACHVFIASCAAINEMIPNDEVGRELGDHFRVYKAMNGV